MGGRLLVRQRCFCTCQAAGSSLVHGIGRMQQRGLRPLGQRGKCDYAASVLNCRALWERKRHMPYPCPMCAACQRAVIALERITKLSITAVAFLPAPCFKLPLRLRITPSGEWPSMTHFCCHSTSTLAECLNLLQHTHTHTHPHTHPHTHHTQNSLDLPMLSLPLVHRLNCRHETLGGGGTEASMPLYPQPCHSLPRLLACSLVLLVHPPRRQRSDWCLVFSDRR